MAEKAKKESSLKKFFSRGKQEKNNTGTDSGDNGPDAGNLDFSFAEGLNPAEGLVLKTKNGIRQEKPEAQKTGSKDSDLQQGNDIYPAGTADNAETRVRPSFEPVKRSVWSGDTQGREEGVITISEMNDLSGLVLPKSATFEIDELKIKARTQIFDLKSRGGIPSHKESGLSGEEFKTVTQAVSAIEAEPPKAGILKKLNLLSVMRHEIDEYDPKLHGPLVDVNFRPRPGIEEIEIYPVNEPFAYIRILYDHATHEYTYEILEPQLTAPEEQLFSEIKERIFERLDINTQNLPEEEARTTLRSVSDDVIADFGLSLTPIQREKILYSMYKEFLGNGMIDPIMHDRYIEDISCDGVNVNLFVYHTRYESMRTNL
jgi:hypothetical protein